MVMSAAAALTSPLVSAHAALHGQVASSLVKPTGTSLLTPMSSQLSPLSSTGISPVDDGLYTLGWGGLATDPVQGDTSTLAFPAFAPTPVLSSAAASTSIFGFDGLSHSDQRFAGTGVYTNTQFSEEPPDQALAVGNGYVLESINNAIAVYKTDGTVASAPVPMYQFLGLPPEYIRGTRKYGSVSLSDPRAYYDASSKRFFVEEWGTGQNPDGSATGTSAIYLAVSQTSDPTGGYTLYTFDTSIDPTLGTDPKGNQIPILPDYVQIGSDANGFYFSINQFDLSGQFGFVGQRILAVSKAALLNGTGTPVVSFSGGDLFNSPAGFTVYPATTPAGGAYETRAGGTEYFLSSVFSSVSNQLSVWAISNTKSLNTKTPSLTLTDTLINSQPFIQPLSAFQKAGPYPFGMSGGATEERLASGDTRMTQVTYVLGHLYSAVETGFANLPAHINAGFTYFSVAPSVDGSGNVSGIVNRQGYVNAVGESLSYPSFGINSTGGAVISCSLVGPDFYPSAAYVTLDSHLKATAIKISSLGAAPDDGFTGYKTDPITGNPVPGPQGIARWGDYSQAQPDENGNMWLAQETISNRSNTTRSLLANYGTFITKVAPTSSFGYK